MIQIPLTNNPNQELQIILDEQECTISVYYRYDKLYLDLMVGDTTICTGAICRNGVSIVQAETLDFSGHLFFYDMNGNDADPTYDQLEDRFYLLYLTEDEDIPDAFQPITLSV